MIELKPVVRVDRAGSGRYGARRGGREHKGVDLIAVPGQLIALSVPMKFNRIGQVYSTTTEYKLVEMRHAAYNDVLVKFMYVDPAVCREIMVTHQLYHPGFVIGAAQDIAARYPNSDMINHIHVEVIRNGKHENPAWWLGVGGE